MDDTKTRRVIISLPADLLTALDGFVKANQYNRSECIRHAIRELLQKQYVQTKA